MLARAEKGTPCDSETGPLLCSGTTAAPCHWRSCREDAASRGIRQSEDLPGKLSVRIVDRCPLAPYPRIKRDIPDRLCNRSGIFFWPDPIANQRCIEDKHAPIQPFLPGPLLDYLAHFWRSNPFLVAGRLGLFSRDLPGRQPRALSSFRGPSQTSGMPAQFGNRSAGCLGSHRVAGRPDSPGSAQSPLVTLDEHGQLFPARLGGDRGGQTRFDHCLHLPANTAAAMDRQSTEPDQNSLLSGRLN